MPVIPYNAGGSALRFARLDSISDFHLLKEPKNGFEAFTLQNLPQPGFGQVLRTF